MSKVKAWARNDRSFEPETAAPPGLLPVRKDQEYLRTVLNYLLKSPDSTSEQPCVPIVLDPNWEKSPWANVHLQTDHPSKWEQRGDPVLVVLPEPPADVPSGSRPLAGRSVRSIATWSGSCFPRTACRTSTTTET